VAAERDVTLKIRTATAGDGGKAMEDLARKTRQAKEEADRMGKAYQDAARQAQQAAAAARTSPAAAAQAPALPAPPPRPGAAAGGAMSQGMDKFSGALANATSNLLGISGAAAVAMKALSAIGSGMKSGYRTGRFEWDDFGTGVMDDLSSIPGIGFVFNTSNQSQRRDERERRLEGLRQSMGMSEFRGNVENQLFARQLALGSQAARYQAIAGSGQLQLQDAGGIAGPARQLQQAQAEAAFTAQAVAAAQAQARQAAGGVERSRRDLSAATSFDEKAERRLQLERAMVEANKALERVQEAQNANLASQQKRQESLVQLAQAKVDKLRSEKQVQDSIVEAEKQKLQGAAGQWGGLSAADRVRALQTGQQLAQRGIEGLSPDQLEFARSIQLFSRTIQEQQQKRGEGDPAFQELVRLLGEDRRLQEAQQISVQVDNKITTEIKLNEATLAQQLQTQVTPRIQEMIDMAVAQAKLDMDRKYLQAVQQRR